MDVDRLNATARSKGATFVIGLADLPGLKEVFRAKIDSWTLEQISCRILIPRIAQKAQRKKKRRR